MAGTTVLMVLDRDDPKRGEISILNEPSEAAHLAEDLIESGVEVERIRIFDAIELQMRVAHKPVVSLGADMGGGSGEQFADEPATAHFDEPEQQPVAVFAGGSDDEAPFDEGQSLSEEPLVRNGVRFSSLFKPAGEIVRDIIEEAQQVIEARFLEPSLTKQPR